MPPHIQEKKKQKRRQEKAKREKKTVKSFQGKTKDRPLRFNCKKGSYQRDEIYVYGIILTVVTFKRVNATRSSRRTIEHVTRHREAARNLWQKDGLTPSTRHPQRTRQSSFVQFRVQFSIGVERAHVQSKLRLSSCHATRRREGRENPSSPPCDQKS